MPLFVLIARDSEEGNRRRSEVRPEHLKFLARLEAEGRIVFAGPLQDDDRERATGSLIIFEAAGRDEAERLMAQDPYVAADVFESAEILPLLQVLPKA